MIKLTINCADGHSCWLEFTSQDEAYTYLAKVTESQHWGLNQRWVESSDEAEIASALESRQVEKERMNLETNELGMVSVTEYLLPAKWSHSQEDITSAFNQEQTNKESLKYLASTDWYVLREMDGGAACPSDIKAARAAARSAIVK